MSALRGALGSPTPAEFRVIDLFRGLWRRKLWILGPVLVACALMAVWDLRKAPVYRGSVLGEVLVNEDFTSFEQGEQALREVAGLEIYLDSAPFRADLEAREPEWFGDLSDIGAEVKPDTDIFAIWVDTNTRGAAAPLADAALELVVERSIDEQTALAAEREASFRQRAESLNAEIDALTAEIDALAIRQAQTSAAVEALSPDEEVEVVDGEPVPVDQAAQDAIGDELEELIFTQRSDDNQVALIGRRRNSLIESQQDLLSAAQGQVAVAELATGDFARRSEARAPGGIYSPKLFRDLAGAALAGLAVGLALAMYRTWGERRVRDRRDIEIAAPGLPTIEASGSLGVEAVALAGARSVVDNRRMTIAVVALDVDRSLVHRFLAGLAEAGSPTGWKALVLDTEATTSPGLRQYLAGRKSGAMTLDDVVETGPHGLAQTSWGTDKPSELLLHPTLPGQLKSHLNASYGLLLIPCTDPRHSAAALGYAAMADAVILLAAPGNTELRDLRETVGQLEVVRSTIVGVAIVDDAQGAGSGVAAPLLVVDEDTVRPPRWRNREGVGLAGEDQREVGSR